MYYTYVYYNGELFHYGINGQKWHHRRFQNEDGSYTPAGKERYSNKSGENTKTSKGMTYDHVISKLKNAKNIHETSKILSDLAPSIWKEYESSKKLTPRVEAAAKLALRAKINLSSSFGNDENDPANIDWMIEDENNFGLALGADLINRGFTANQIRTLSDEASLASAKDNELKGDRLVSVNELSVFSIGYDDDLNFLDECERIYNEDKKLKHSYVDVSCIYVDGRVKLVFNPSK